MPQTLEGMQTFQFCVTAHRAKMQITNAALRYCTAGRSARTRSIHRKFIPRSSCGLSSLERLEYSPPLRERSHLGFGMAPLRIHRPQRWSQGVSSLVLATRPGSFGFSAKSPETVRAAAVYSGTLGSDLDKLGRFGVLTEVPQRR